MKKTKAAIKRIVIILTMLCVLSTLLVPVFATEMNQKVMEAKNGVVQIQVWFVDADYAIEQYLGFGTGFLINADTVVTCQHVISGFSAETYAQWAKETGRKVDEVKKNLELRISVLRDVHVKASIKQASTEMDYAILTLGETLHNRSALPLRSSESVKQTEPVFALGFPGELNAMQDLNIYTAEDVNVTAGIANKVERFSFATMEGQTYKDVNCIEHSALLQSGNSGGPLLDASGNVIGINAAGNEKHNFSVASDQLIATLDALGIEYTKADGTASAPASTSSTSATSDTTASAPAPAPEEPQQAETTDKTKLNAAVTEAQKIEVKGYDEASGAAFTRALEEAQNILANETATQAQIDASASSLTSAQMSLVKSAGFPIGIVVAIGVGVVLIAAIVVAVLLLGKKKQAPAVSANAAYTPGGTGFNAAPSTPQQNFAVPQGSSDAQPTSLLNAGARDTTLLNAGSGETTLLKQNANLGTLIRTKTGEKIAINSANFVIGKESNRVNYYIADNTSVSRTHVRITNKGGAAYVADLKTTNGSFLDGVRLSPEQETLLNNGAKLLLADEEFIYQAR